MDDYAETKNKMQTIFFVGVSAKDGIVHSLRDFFDTLKERDINNCASLRKELKKLQGKYFKDEGTFMLSQKSRNNGDAASFVNISIDNKELKEFRKTCKEYGVDVLFIKRPEDVEGLYNKKLKGESISENQKQIVEAFTITDDKGNSCLKDDANMICFNSRDIAVVEKVLDKMEARTQNIQQRIMRAKRAKDKASKIVKRTKEKIKKPVSKTK